MSAPAGVHEPSGDGEDPVLQGARGGILEVRSAQTAYRASNRMVRTKPDIDG